MTLRSFAGFAEKVPRNGGHEGDASLRAVADADKSGYSDSNSEVSVAESAVSHSNNTGPVLGDRDHDIKEKISFPFIDFLGAGPI